MDRFIAVSPHAGGHGFIEGATGAPFVPIGCNYFDPATGWAPKIWSRFDPERVGAQLKQIGQAGFTTVRVFLDMGTLNPTPGSYSEEGFAKVARMIELVRAAGLRIIFSGPNGWEGRAHHAWGDSYADQPYLDLRCELWRRIMQRFGDDPTVMAWDLMNEPSVGWPDSQHADQPYLQPRLAKWCAFANEHAGALPVPARRDSGVLPGVEPGRRFPQVDPAGEDRQIYAHYVRFQEHLTERWVARQCEAIREAGGKQLITLGMHQSSIPIFLPKAYSYGGFNPQQIGRHLDYMSVHFYPMLEDVDRGMVEEQLTIRRGYVEIVARAAHVAGKPLVIEEFGWKGGNRVPREIKTWPQEHQTLWCDTLVRATRGVASGWLNWAYADSPDPTADISAASGLWTSDGKQMKHWGKRFAQLAEQFKASPPTYRHAAKRYEIDLVDYLYRGGGRPDESWLAEHCSQEHPDGIEVVLTRPWLRSLHSAA